MMFNNTGYIIILFGFLTSIDMATDITIYQTVDNSYHEPIIIIIIMIYSFIYYHSIYR